MTTLKLTLSKDPFDVMKTGEKQIEYRRKSKWIESRLYNKNGTPREYDYIEFVNGYGKDKPRFKAEFKGFIVKNYINETYSNGLQVCLYEPTYCIHLGKICHFDTFEKSGVKK